MSVRFVLGRAGVGKTRHCIDSVLDALRGARGTSAILLLVPEQASFQMERALALRSPRGGFAFAEVLSFSRLATRVFAEFGIAPALHDAAARALALRALVARRPHLIHPFGAAARSAPFFSRLARLIGELLSEAVAPAQLRACASSASMGGNLRRVAAVADLLEAYLAALSDRQSDEALRLAHVRERMATLPWLRDARIWIDGFAGFTGQELATVEALAATAARIEITLLCDPHDLPSGDGRKPPDPMRLFHTTEWTLTELTHALREAGVAIEPHLELDDKTPSRFQRAPALAWLEQCWATPDEPRRAPASSGREVRVVRCESQRAEWRTAARHIRRRVIESGQSLRFRDFAIIARDIEPLAALASDALTACEVPFFLDRRRPLHSHALCRFISTLCQLIRSDFSLPAAVRLLQSGLLPFERDDCERFENRLLAADGHGWSRWCDGRWLLAPVREERDEAQRADALRVSIVAASQSLNEQARAGAPCAAATWCALLKAALEHAGVRRVLSRWVAEAIARNAREEAESHRLAWDATAEVLQRIESVLGHTPLSFDEFGDVLMTTLSEATIAIAPPAVDQVLVTSIDRSRHPDVRFAWLIGFNEGVFPAPPDDASILSESERRSVEAAGLRAPRSPQAEIFDERLLAYIALTRPSDGLVISFADTGDEGRDALPSRLLDDVLRILPNVSIERPQPDQPPACVDELARVAFGASARGQRRARELAARLRDSALGGRCARALRGMEYRNLELPLSTTEAREAHDAKKEQSPVWEGSATELETYLQCPFRHFARYALRLEAQRRSDPIETELGSFAHEVLAETTRRAIDAGPSVRTASDERWLEWLSSALHARRALDADSAARRRAEFVSLSRAQEGLLREVVLAHAARFRRGDFEPLATELRFGKHPRAPQDDRRLLLDLPQCGSIALHGSVDRVDYHRSGETTYLLVYDYKSAIESLRPIFLTGKRLQAFVYLLAVEQWYTGMGRVRASGVMLAPLYPSTSALNSRTFTTASVEDQRMRLFQPRGLFAETIGDCLDRELESGPSPVAQMRLTKDGAFWKNADARPASEVDEYLDVARRTIALAAAGIVSGCVDIAPLIEKRTLACKTCDFKSVCRFDRAYNIPRVAERTLPLVKIASEIDLRSEPE